MTPATLAAGALVLGLLIGGSVVVGAPVLAVPIVIVGIAIFGLLNMRRKTRETSDIHEFRRQAETEPVEFTERDRQTTV